MERYKSKFEETFGAGFSKPVEKDPNRRDVFEMDKDRFAPGEWSIYKRDYRDGEVSAEIYLFGISKRNEAQKVLDYLNKGK